MRTSLIAALTLAATATMNATATPAPVAQYDFNSNFASSVAGAPALVETNPLGTSGFGTDTVFGTSRTVYNFNGNTTPSEQGGLSLDTSGLLPSNSTYSVELVFKFTEHENAWRRIVDVQNRQSDNGFYVDPSNNLDIYPVAGGAPFSNNVYHDVFLSNDNGVVSFYLDGSAQATVVTPVMNIDASNTVNFFLDNVVAGGQGEYSSGSIALIRFYDVAIADNIPTVPEPGTYALLFAGLGVVGWAARRRSPAAR